MGCTGFSALDKLCESVMQMKVWLKQVDVTSNCCSSVETKQVIVRKRTHAYRTGTSQLDLGSDDNDRASPSSAETTKPAPSTKKVVLEDTTTKEEHTLHKSGLATHKTVNVDVETLVHPSVAGAHVHNPLYAHAKDEPEGPSLPPPPK